jgi:hypothetical protein
MNDLASLNIPLMFVTPSSPSEDAGTEVRLIAPSNALAILVNPPYPTR